MRGMVPGHASQFGAGTCALASTRHARRAGCLTSRGTRSTRTRTTTKCKCARRAERAHSPNAPGDLSATTATRSRLSATGSGSDSSMDESRRSRTPTYSLMTFPGFLAGPGHESGGMHNRSHRLSVPGPVSNEPLLRPGRLPLCLRLRGRRRRGQRHPAQCLLGQTLRLLQPGHQQPQHPLQKPARRRPLARKCWP